MADQPDAGAAAPASALPPATLAARLAAELPAWVLVSDAQGQAIERRWRTAHWPATLLAANAVAQLAEAAWHHPELRLRYAELTVRLSTHDAGDRVTARDLALAARIDALLDWRPGAEPGCALTGPPSATPDGHLRLGD